MTISSDWYYKEHSDIENDIAHRPPGEEIGFYRSVSSGDIDAVRENCEQKRFLNMDGVGKLSRNPITNLKYHFVVTTAFITRFCTEAGMEMEQAFRLSDFYILKLDNLNTAEAISNLHDRMVLDYTGKMRLLQKNAGTSKSISECIDYIYTHIKDRITVEDLSEYTQLSTSYLSRLFKQEVGISVSDYIREKKIEKAQNLLRYCDYTPIEIANYLSFSSQSHFIQAFKKLVGMTPKKYREFYFRTSWNTEKSDSQPEVSKPDTAE